MSLYSSLTQVLAPFAAKINGLLTGWDGTRYTTPGEAVRQQIADLHVLIGDEPGRAISASAISYGDSDVETALDGVNGRLTNIADTDSEVTESKLIDIDSTLTNYENIVGTVNTTTDSSTYNPGCLINTSLTAWTSYVFRITDEVAIFAPQDCLNYYRDTDYYAIGVVGGPSVVKKTDAVNAYYKGSSKARYRNLDSNLPTESNPLTVHAGDVVIITMTVATPTVPKKIGIVTHPLVFGDVKFNDAQKTEIINISNGEGRNHIKWSDSLNGFNIDLARHDGFIRHEFMRYQNVSSNADVWILDLCYYVNDAGTPLQLSTLGEWEMAVKIKDAPDFIGGKRHGSEIIDGNIDLYIDGKKVSVADFSSIDMDFDVITIMEKSTMYDPTDETTVVGTHTKLYTFGHNVNIKQSVKWIGAHTLETSYMHMMPPSKNVVSDYYTESNLCPVTYTSGNFITVPGDSLAGVVGSNATFEMIATKPIKTNALPIVLIGDNSGNNYIKCYVVSANNDDAVSDGDIWRTETQYHIDYKP